MWELDYKESWVTKNWCFWTVVLKKTLESPLDRREIQPVNPKGNQSWIFIGRTDAEAETPILWSPDAKNWFIGCWFWERLKAGEGDDRGWDGWMASPTRWTWVWASSRNWWWTGKAGVLHSMGLQRVGHDWAEGIINPWSSQLSLGHPLDLHWNQMRMERWESESIILASLPPSHPVSQSLTAFQRWIRVSRTRFQKKKWLESHSHSCPGHPCFSSPSN